MLHFQRAKKLSTYANIEVAANMGDSALYYYFILRACFWLQVYSQSHIYWPSFRPLEKANKHGMQKCIGREIETKKFMTHFVLCVGIPIILPLLFGASHAPSFCCLRSQCISDTFFNL